MALARLGEKLILGVRAQYNHLMPKRLHQPCLVGAAVVLALATARGASLPDQPFQVSPAGAWSGLDASSLHAIASRAADLPRLHSLLISHDGELMAEWYFNGATATKLANLKSVSKSVISALVGLAVRDGHLSGVAETIDTYFPNDLANADDPRKRDITIEDLLTMRSGLETTSNRNYGRWVHSRNWVRHILTRPMVEAPGERMIYSTGSTHLVSAILTQATGMSTLEFARVQLGTPLGITLRPWLADPQGIYFGGNEMYLRPRDMLKFGELYLNCGRAAGQQILPEEWIHRSTTGHTQSRRSGREYGYGWWIRTLGGHRAFYAWGYGGQFIFVVPDLDLAVVMTSRADPSPRRRGHLRSLYDLMDRYLVPAAEAAAN